MNLEGILFYVLRAARFSLVISAVWVLLRLIWLSAKRQPPDWKAGLKKLLFVAYAAALTEIIALRGGETVSRQLCMVPLQTTLGQLRLGWWPFVYHLVGNLIWFVPLGMFLRRYGCLRAMLIGAGVSLALEALQWLLSTGMTDIDDVIINAAGALLGTWIGRILSRFRHKTL